MVSLGQISASDVLRPPILKIDGINYRRNAYLKNESHDGKIYRMKDLEEACDIYEDECCDAGNFKIEESDGGFKALLNIPSVFHRFIVGHKGGTRHKLEAETGAKIILPPKGQDGDIVVKGKEQKNVLSACTRISLIVETEKKRLPFTHFLSFSVVSDEIIKGFENFRDQVFKKYKSRGIDDSIFQNPKKLHLTLGVMVIVDETDKMKIQEVLNDCKQTLTNEGFFDAPLNLRMKGLEYMNDDPNSVDVLYAKVELDDESDRLQVIADKIVKACETSGLMKEQFDRVKLHVTVINTLFRKGAESEVQDARRKRERFDASQVLKNLKDYYFGKIQLKGLHLSRLHSVNSEGYYESDYYLEF